MTVNPLVTVGRLDTADAYRRLADAALAAAAHISDPDSTPGGEQSSYLTVEDRLLTVAQRLDRLAAARRGDLRGRQAGAA